MISIGDDYNLHPYPALVLQEYETAKAEKKGVMWTAAVSAFLDPICRNSQKSVKKLLMAVAAHEEGLHHHSSLGSQKLDMVPGPTPTLTV